MIARDGVMVEPFVAPHVAHLPLVVGNGAHTKAADFLTVMNNYPALRDQVHAYVLVAERRWNLRLKNGIDVRLPEAEPGRGDRGAAGARSRQEAFEPRHRRDRSARSPTASPCGLSDEAAAARAEALKDKKDKRKGGDA